MKIGVLGAGTWGIALASLLVSNNHEVTLWSAIPSEIDELSENGVHRNLPGIILPKSIRYTKDIKIIADEAEMILVVVPSSFVRATAEKILSHLRDGVILVTAAKGIEKGRDNFRRHRLLTPRAEIPYCRPVGPYSRRGGCGRNSHLYRVCL